MSEPRFFSDEEVLAVVEQVVAEAGHDYVYEVNYGPGCGTGLGNGCHYVRNEQPSCLIGRVAHRLGAPIEWLKQMESTSAMTVCGFPPDWIDMTRHPENTYFRVSKQMALALDAAQSAQDAQRPWGVALDRMRGQLGLLIG